MSRKRCLKFSTLQKPVQELNSKQLSSIKQYERDFSAVEEWESGGGGGLETGLVFLSICEPVI